MLNIGALNELQSEIIDKKNSYDGICIELLIDLLFIKDDTSYNGVLNDEEVNSKKRNNQKEVQSQLEVENERKKHKLMEELVKAFFILGKSNQAINIIIERLQPELRYMIQKIIVLVKNLQEPNSNLLESTANNSDLFKKLLISIFKRTVEILENHLFVINLFETYQSTIAATQIHNENQLEIYNLSQVWDSFQKEIQMLIAHQIDASKETFQTEIQENNFNNDNVYLKSKLFSFSNSSAFTLYEISNNQNFEYRDINFGDPSCYNLPPIYGLIFSFCERCERLIGDKSNKKGSLLQNWIDYFIINNFMARIHSDYKNRVYNACQASDSFKIQENKIEKNKQEFINMSVFTCALDTYFCIQELVQISSFLPRFYTRCHSIIEDLLMIYHSQMKMKLEECGRDTESLKTIRDVEFSKLIEENPQWKKIKKFNKTITKEDQIRLDSPRINRKNKNSFEPVSKEIGNSENDSFNVNILDYEYAWHTGTTNLGIPLQLHHMISESKLLFLASIHNSCLWLSNHIFNLDQLNESNKIKTTNKNIPSTPLKLKNPSLNSNQNNFKNSGEFWENLPIFFPKFTSNVLSTASKLIEISDQSLNLIFVDFRLKTCYYLQNIKKKYVFVSEDYIPDDNVTKLNETLQNGYLILQSHLTNYKLKYIFNLLPILMSSLLIDALKSCIEAINRFGVFKMIRNVFALQQNLTNIITFSEDPFDRVRRYYELLNLPANDVYQFISEHSHETSGNYTLNQYRTVLEIILNPKGRTLNDDQEKELRENFSL